MPFRTLQSIADTIQAHAPEDCCENVAECMKAAGAEDAEGFCLTNPGRRAARAAFVVRIGRDPARSPSNPKASGRKTWIPSPDGWLTIATLAEDLGQYSERITEGDYRFIFGDADSNEIALDDLPCIPYQPERQGNSDAGRAGGGPPQPRQVHLDDVHRVTLERAKIDNGATQSKEEALHAAYSLMNEILKTQADAQKAQYAAQKENNEVLKGLQEQLGMQIQLLHTVTKSCSEAILNSKPTEPTAVLVIRTVGEVINELKKSLMEFAVTGLITAAKEERAKQEAAPRKE